MILVRSRSHTGIRERPDCHIRDMHSASMRELASSMNTSFKLTMISIEIY